MKSLKKLYAPFLISAGVVIGMFASDLAANVGITDSKYVVELKHEQSRQADVKCSRKAVNGGFNMSGIDPKTMVQTNCRWMLYGHPMADGSFAVHRGWETWTGRFANRSTPLVIAADEIVEMHKYMFDPFPWFQ